MGAGCGCIPRRRPPPPPYPPPGRRADPDAVIRGLAISLVELEARLDHTNMVIDRQVEALLRLEAALVNQGAIDREIAMLVDDDHDGRDADDDHGDGDDDDQYEDGDENDDDDDGDDDDDHDGHDERL